ncbi:MAG TPA: AIR synthase, partial [Pricia sp.]|nr:AIR synthase [Pricia sp.]
MEERTGKIAHPFFERFIRDKCGKKRPEVRVGPRFGVDVSIVDLPNGQAMAMASDPLSLIPSLG